MGTLHIDVSFAAGALALAVELEAPPGITVLFGPSGAGKTTTLHLVAGLLRPTSGQIRLDDEIWAGPQKWVPPERRRVGLVLQTPALFPHLSVVQNVAFGVRDTAQKQARALAALTRTGVEALAERRIDSLSGGEAQRVALARALAMEPEVLLLDEPFAALDQARRTQLGQTLETLVTALALPTLFVTHDAAEAKTLGDRIVHLENGRVTVNP